MHELIGTLVLWDGELWYADYSDENFKDDDEETSLFLLPSKYADYDEYQKLWDSPHFDSTGYWVHVSDVTPA